MDRIELFLTVHQLPAEQFVQYCRKIDALVDEMRAQRLPVLRPYTHETTLEILVGAGAVMALATVGQALARFVENVTENRSIPYVEIEGTHREKGRADVVVSIRATDAEGIVRALELVMHKLAKE